MAIECPIRRLLNVTFLREIVEPKPSDGTQEQSRHLTQSARHPQGESMIDRKIPEARRVRSVSPVSKQLEQFAEPPRAIWICTGASWFLKRLELGARRHPVDGSARHGHGRLGAQPRFHVRDHGTCGLISRDGVFPLATSLDHVGPMT
jgi:hypothetical protein